NMAAAGNTKLTEAQLDQEIERELRTATDDRGRAISKAQAIERGIVDQIYQRELFRTALMAYADQLGAVATDDAVLDVIRSDTSFQGDTGKFDPVRFQQLLQSNGFSVPMFENYLKRDMTIARLTGATQTGLQAPLAISSLQAAFNGELRSIEWFVLPRSALPPVDEITDEELEEFYTQQKQNLTQPQRRKISLIELTLDDFLSQADLSEDDLRAYYEAVKDRQFAGPDTRTWTEFVFSSEDVARQALGRIAGGADPSTIAGIANSAQRTGQRTDMSSADLAERVFGPAAQPGGIYGPIRTGSFYTIARLESVQPGDVEPFEAVRDEIVNELSREQAVGLYYDSLTRLDNLIGTGANLEEIASEMGTPVLSFEAVDRTGVTHLGLAPSVLRSDPDILTRAFDLTAGGKTARFGQDEVAYILRVDQIKEAYTPELDEIRDDLRTVMLAQRESEALTTAAQDLKLELEAGDKTLEQAAAEFGASVVSPEAGFTRQTTNSPAVPRQFIAGAFSVRDEGGVYIAPTQNRDEVAIVQLKSIDRASEAELRALAPISQQQIQAQLASDLLDAFAAEIQRSVELKVNSDAYTSYKSRVSPDS
ncbi:MAG: peptidyl-prolyl cis-trans isomerase, partial [Henriciella sp.]